MSNSTSASSLSPEYPILGLLHQGASHGYALHAKLREELGQIWNISQSQTYSILKRLEDQELVVGTEEAQETGPDRYRLHLTQAGRDHLQRWLRTPSGLSTQALRVDFLTRLYFARKMHPGLLPQLIQDQTGQITDGIKKLEHRLADIKESNQINQWALEVRIHQLQGFLEWLRRMEKALAKTQ